jgi:hypothetical protein
MNKVGSRQLLVKKTVIVYRVSPGRQSEQAVDRWSIKPVERLDATERRKSFSE